MTEKSAHAAYNEMLAAQQRYFNWRKNDPYVPKEQLGQEYVQAIDAFNQAKERNDRIQAEYGETYGFGDDLVRSTKELPGKAWSFLKGSLSGDATGLLDLAPTRDMHPSSVAPMPPPVPGSEGYIDPADIPTGDVVREAIGTDNPAGAWGELFSPSMAFKGLGSVGAMAMMAMPKSSLDNIARLLAGKTKKELLAEGIDPPLPTTTPGRIINETMNEGGYSVNMATGELPTEGLMVGKYANDSPNNLILPGKPTSRDVLSFVKTNKKALGDINNYLGTWREADSGLIYFDVSRRFGPDEIRKATKAGERTGQKAGYDIGRGQEFPIGNWHEFINSPEFQRRMVEMRDVGQRYLAQHPTKEWWDIHGTVFEQIYGRENLEIVAGYIASTAPNRNPTLNLRAMTEYMRRHLIGEPIIQPDWRKPEGIISGNPGTKIGLEETARNNLILSEAGRYREIPGDKVRNEAMALMGDQDAGVFDRWWARLSEDPKSGVYIGTREGAIPSPTDSYNPYREMYLVVDQGAKASGQTIRNFSADVWTGVRETVKATDELFGMRFKGSALVGESKGYADLFDDLIREKAKFVGMSVDNFKEELSKGRAELLSLVLATPLGALAFEQMTADGPSSADLASALGPAGQSQPGARNWPAQGNL